MSHPLHPTPSEESKCAQCAKEHDMDELRDKLAALTASHAACVRAARRFCFVHAGATVDQIRAATIAMARTAPDPTAASDTIALLDALCDPLAREVSDGS